MNLFTLEGNSITKDGKIFAAYDSKTTTVATATKPGKDDSAAIRKLLRGLGAPKVVFSVAKKEKEKPRKNAPPPPPPNHPRLGDKDPLFIAWFRQTHTEAEFTARYQGRKYEE